MILNIPRIKNFQTDPFDRHMETSLVLPLRVRVELGIMAMKEYSPLLRAFELEPHYLVQYSVIQRTSIFVGNAVSGS